MEHRHKEKLNTDWQQTKEIVQEINRIWKRSKLFSFFFFSPDSTHHCYYKSRTYLYLSIYTTCPSCPPHGDLVPTGEFSSLDIFQYRPSKVLKQQIPEEVDDRKKNSRQSCSCGPRRKVKAHS